MMIFRRLLFLLLAVVAGSNGQVQAQVALYRLTFDQIGESINYRPYQNGYYVAPMEGGSGSLVLTMVTGNTRQYFVYEGFGELFVAVKGETQKMVLSATAANDVSTTVFYALGTATKQFDVQSRNMSGKVKVAEKMEGYAVSADSEQDLPFFGTGMSIGVAGASQLTARLDKTYTNKALQENLDAAAAVDAVLEALTAAGYVDGNPQSGNGGGGNTGGTTRPPQMGSNGGTQPPTTDPGNDDEPTDDPDEDEEDEDMDSETD